MHHILSRRSHPHLNQVLENDDFGLKFGILLPYHDLQDPSKYVVGDESIKALIPGLFLLGCIAGALSVSYLADSIGRKRCIIMGGVFFVLGGVFQTVADVLGIMYTGRILSGVGIGVLSMVVPLYIGETSPTHLRGSLVAVQQLMITLGILIASIVNSFFIIFLQGDAIWRSCLGAQNVPGVLLVVIMCFMPFSPRWLADKDRNAEGIQVLGKLRNLDVTSPELKNEYREIMESVEDERRVGNADWSELGKPGIMNRVIMAVILQMFQQLTGINAIMYYQVTLLKAMGIDPKSASISFAIANNFINFIATFPGMYLIEKLGRRKLLIVGGFGMGLAQFGVTIFLGFSSQVPWLSWLAIVCIYFFLIFFASTWGPVVWVYQSEIFPQRVRAKASSLATTSNWVWNAIVTFSVPFLISRINIYVYLIFGSFGILMSLYTMFQVPETMGKSLEEMEVLFSTGGVVSCHDEEAGMGTRYRGGYVAPEMKDYAKH